MKIFGEKEEFAIGLEFSIEKYPYDDYIKQNIEECWEFSEVYFWVKGKNLFELIDSESFPTYFSHTLHALIDYYCNFLVFHISDDPFPIKSKATNACSMIEETALIKSDKNWQAKVLNIDWDNIDMDLRNKRDLWMYHHGFIQNRRGTFLPDAYMRKVNDKIEVSWHNKYPYESAEREYYFRYKQG